MSFVSGLPFSLFVTQQSIKDHCFGRGVIFEFHDGFNDMDQFHLSSVLIGHSEDVRFFIFVLVFVPSLGGSCNTASPNVYVTLYVNSYDPGAMQVRCVTNFTSSLDEKNVIVTGSRDKSIRIWKAGEQGEYVCVSGAMDGHTDYVTALSAFTSTQDVIVSGSRDTTIRLWGEVVSPDVVLTGHEYQVTGVVTVENGGQGCVVSTSLDRSVRLWKLEDDYSKGSCVAVCNDHEGPVLCVSPCGDDGMIVTGSGDCSMRIWRVENDTLTCTSVIKGHTDTVRSVACVPGIGIASGSHDTTVKVWTMDGHCVQTCEGHEAIIYTVAVSKDSTLIASGSEDNTVRIWNLNGECLQVIRHPACIWGVCFLSNGDLVTACADGVARVWSLTDSRKASDDVIAAFEAQVDMTLSKPEQGNEGGSNEQLKMYSASALQEPGQYDGHTIVVKEGVSGMVYTWNQQAGDWEKVGEVMTDGMDMKTEWDFSFDVDIADDQPKLKLCANAGEDAYEVAERFIAENNLPTSYREQIAQFLITNTSGKVNIGLDTSGAYVDPFTGANAYVPSSSQPTSGYTGSAVGLGAQGNVDPFTGSGMKGSKLPVKEYQLFSAQLASANARSKIEEFNDELDASNTISSDSEWQQIDALIQEATVPTRGIEAIPPVVAKMMQWPLNKVFPLLDIFRALIMEPHGRKLMMDALTSIHQSPEKNSLGAIMGALLGSDGNNAGTTVALRLLVNLFQPETIHIIASNMDYFLDMMDRLKDCMASSKGIQNAYTTFLTNAAVFLQKTTSTSPSIVTKIAVQASSFVSTFASDPSSSAALSNALLALGTLQRENLIKRSEIRYMLCNDVLDAVIQRQGDESIIATEIRSNML